MEGVRVQIQGGRRQPAPAVGRPASAAARLADVVRIADHLRSSAVVSELLRPPSRRLPRRAAAAREQSVSGCAAEVRPRHVVSLSFWLERVVDTRAARSLLTGDDGNALIVDEARIASKLPAHCDADAAKSGGVPRSDRAMAAE